MGIGRERDFQYVEEGEELTVSSSQSKGIIIPFWEAQSTINL